MKTCGAVTSAGGYCYSEGCKYEGAGSKACLLVGKQTGVVQEEASHGKSWKSTVAQRSSMLVLSCPPHSSAGRSNSDRIKRRARGHDGPHGSRETEVYTPEPRGGAAAGKEKHLFLCGQGALNPEGSSSSSSSSSAQIH
ncbi:hypothetical protein EYF80_003738 [Liparis tanakae]|uniref:Uncharacterized protein n=1 Tax=Liparis tanakae TaxID=230148 RepID=A0A4Z2J7K2_9TELE|nr:hypothetical protein EYF80_003738 [Liparis tanakae]